MTWYLAFTTSGRTAKAVRPVISGKFRRQVNKKISSCFWTTSTCVQRSSLGWCSRLTYMETVDWIHVTMDYTNSPWRNKLSLGPILFIIYINDLPNHVSCNIKMFSDDAKIYSSVRSESEAEKIQEHLEKLQEWSDTWLLRFNAGKCKTMHIGSGNPNCDYHMGETTLDGTEEEKDLGVYITSDFKSSTHSSKAATKWMNCLRVVRRSFKYIDADSFQILYKTYIRPHLEYCVQAWCPWLEKDKQALERVQRRATKLVPALKNLPYEERLQGLNLYSLEKRRERGDLIL